MPKLRALRKQEEIDAIPPDEPVTVDLSPDPVAAAGEGDAPPAPTPPPAPEPPPPDEPDATAQLRKALADSQAAEKLQKERADREAAARADAERRAQEQQEIARTRGVDAEQAQYDAISNALAATQTEIDNAKRDVQAAGESGDWAKLADAQARLGAASGRLVQLEDGKAAFDQRREELKNAPPPRSNGAAPTVEDRVDAMQGLTGAEKDWLKQHPDALTDPRRNARLGAAYWEAVDKGHARGTPEYFQFLEEQLGYRQAAPAPTGDDDPDDPPPPPPSRRMPPVSAPVSRDIPSAGTGRPSSTKVTLTAAEREAARYSGISEVEYAKQKQRLQEEKRNGNYVESR